MNRQVRVRMKTPIERKAMKCAHEGCTCQVVAPEEYCSEHCRQHGAHAEEMGCECGHAECEGTHKAM